MKLGQAFGVTASIASRMAFQRSGRVLAAAFLRAALILAKARSMGLKSGLYGGRRRSSATAASMTFLTARGFLAGRLSMPTLRSEERGGGKACVSRGRSWWTRLHEQKKGESSHT